MNYTIKLFVNIDNNGNNDNNDNNDYFDYLYTCDYFVD